MISRRRCPRPKVRRWIVLLKALPGAFEGKNENPVPQPDARRVQANVHTASTQPGQTRELRVWPNLFVS
jgi:hypothetical protein